MCGICGELRLDGAPSDIAVIRRMADKLARRGPDHEGIITDGPLGFGHRRLAIIDLSDHADQPMVDKTLQPRPGLQRHHLQLQGVASGTCRSWATAFSPKATAKSSSRPTMPGARNAWSVSTACSPSRCGTCATSRCSWRATASASSRSIIRWKAASLRFASSIAGTAGGGRRGYLASIRSPCITTSRCMPWCPRRAPSSTASKSCRRPPP